MAAWDRSKPHPPDLRAWRARLNLELQTDSRGFLGSRLQHLQLPQEFPNTEVLMLYLNPSVSVLGERGGGHLRDTGELNLSKLATPCEQKFDEWGYREIILKRFRGNIWHPALIRVLRRAALQVRKQQVEELEEV
jgi:Holliday junction resolvase YEN1